MATLDGKPASEVARADTATEGPAPDAPGGVPDAYRQASADVADRLGVLPGLGLSTGQVRATAVWGANRLSEPARRPEWLKFLDQFRNWLIVILLIAAVVAGAIGDLRDAVVITVVLQVNAVLGYWQERRAESSLEALRRMLVPMAKVRRDGTEQVVGAQLLVPGDVVLLEAGDRVPADGRLTVAETVEADEAALTGESQPVAKSVTAVDPTSTDPAPLAERTSMLFMNTALTRGRAEMIVTATGMRTEVGAIAEALRTGTEPPSPLQVQLDSLGRRLALLSGVAVVAYALSAWVRGEPLSDIALQAVALAVAAIPEGLPAVLALTLALGVHRMARRGAIVKRLASVESLGAATVVCSDKTGTLTLNEMTARTMWTGGRLYDVTGEGYGTTGTLRLHGEHRTSPADALPDGDDMSPPDDLRDAVLPFALCNDAHLTDGYFIGDPTEAALVALAAKAGVDADWTRTGQPRVGELPFDGATKYMATFHTDPDGRTRVHVKGAVDVLLGMCTDVVTPDGVRALDEGHRDEVLAVTAGFGGAGLRVLGAATALLEGTPSTFTPDVLPGLTLVSIAGIADPPRPQARDAMALCRTAGVAVKMITGDHADTAAAIARELDIAGDVVTGAELDRMTEGQLAERVDDIGVFARVAPEHKVVIVRALTDRGHIVAMTGDGVNDAAALKAAHIGVAMGVTGTDVAKEAADMVLTDDDFSTIVRAVREGRAIYANIVKFVRFQLATNIGRDPHPAQRLPRRTALPAHRGPTAVDQHHHGRSARDGPGRRPGPRRCDAPPAARPGRADPGRPPPPRHRLGRRGHGRGDRDTLRRRPLVRRRGHRPDHGVHHVRPVPAAQRAERPLLLAGVIAADLWDHERWHMVAARHVAITREAGALSELPLALDSTAVVHVFAGELAVAASLIEEARTVSAAIGSNQPPFGALALAAIRGREARTLIDATISESVPRGQGLGVSVAYSHHAVLCNGLAQYANALTAAQAAAAHQWEFGAPRWGLAELIEAAVRGGAPELAPDALEQLSETAQASGTDWALGIEARSRALLSEGDAAERLYREAIERLARTRVRVELARAHLVYGEWLRRENRRVDARDQLGVAHDLFSRIGAEAFAERARGELQATGAKVRRHAVATPTALTSQEAQIARLAGEGLTNSEIGTQLFLSPHTVEWHLRKVFSKLGISSRKEIRALRLEGEATSA